MNIHDATKGKPMRSRIFVALAPLAAVAALAGCSSGGQSASDNAQSWTETKAAGQIERDVVEMLNESADPNVQNADVGRALCRDRGIVENGDQQFDCLIAITDVGMAPVDTRITLRVRPDGSFEWRGSDYVDPFAE